MVGAVGGVNWEEYCASLHDGYAWGEPHRRHEVSIDGREFGREDRCKPDWRTGNPVKSVEFPSWDCGNVLTPISRKGWFEDATDVYLGHFGSYRGGMGHIRKTRTSARTLMGPIRVLFGRPLALVLSVSFPSDLVVCGLSQRWPLLPRPEVCQIHRHEYWK